MTDDELKRFVGSLADPTLILAADGAIVAANPPATRLTGLPDEPHNRLHDWIPDPASADRLIRQWSRTSRPSPATVSLLTKDGVVDYRADGARMPSNGAPRILLRLRARTDGLRHFYALNERLADLGREINRRRRAESRLEAQLRLLERVARSESLPTSLSEIAGFVEAESPNGALASILLVEDGKLRHGTAPNLPAAYNAAIDGVPIGPCVGSCGTAAFTGKTVVVSDIASDPLWRDFKDIALAHGLRACWSTPVISNSGQVLATVAHYYRHPRRPDQIDKQLSELARHVVEIAIDRHRVEEALRVRAAELAEVNTRKNEFLAMLGHELRNPLSSMVLTLESLSRHDADAERRVERITILERQLSLVRRLVDDLLDVSRVTRGKVELRCRPIDLRECVTIVTGTRAQDDSRIHVAVPEGPVWVHGDSERLQQVIDNLLHNACKFTPDDGRVDVALESTEAQATLRLVDTGAGIDAADLPHVFELFAQSSRPLHRPLGGLGIGLTLAQSLVAGHGGTIDVRSEGVGCGSEFVVRLPLCDPPTVSAHGERETVERAPRRPEGLDILVVDDDVDSANLLAELLELQGHAVRVAYDGPGAIDAAKQRPPELLILDIGLPAMDGYEVARRLRNDVENGSRRCTMIALTGYGQPSDHAQALEAGFDAFMVKPVDLPKLQQLIDASVRDR